jgi:hypothetical protein
LDEREIKKNESWPRKKDLIHENFDIIYMAVFAQRQEHYNYLP